ncbi:uncharacterized protein LOC116042083 isoform X2 [Sander lucioperca]|uniref:uncharacterized protein LOC116042083 isoform X2 n=1 Tax=Sander lucioperca TaxID=283035 RepID=UPI001653D597|nr:uncharacterized protein LOC116042083 isoform X2 [Sander lucioperca]
MRSGFPHSQAGAYSVFQDWSNVGARRLPQDFNVTPVPVVHPEVGKQNNMVATQYPEELRVTCSRVPLQQGYQSQKLYHQQESQATVTSTGFQHPRPGDGACISQNMQMSRKDNADFYSSAYVSAQHSSYFGTSAYENSVRLPDSNSGQQKEYSKQNFSWRFQNKSNWNHDTGLQQPLNCAFKDCTSSAALQGDRLEVPAQTFPLQDQCSSVTVCKKMSSSPLLEALLKGTSSELPWPSEETNGNIDLNTKAIILNKGHRKCQQVKGSPTVLNCGQARAQNLDHSTGTPSTPYQQQVSSRRLSSRPSTDKLMSAAKTRPPTDVEIQNFLAQRLMYFRSILTQKNTNPGHSNKDLDRNSTLQSDSIMPKVDGVARLPTTSAKDDVERQSHNWGANEQCTVGQARKEDSSKDRKVNGKLILKSKDTDDCATSASEKHSTEYPRIMMDVAATCTKNEDESPVVLTAVPQMTWDELTEKQPSSPDVSEELQTKSSSVASENQTFKCLPRIENQDANTKEKKTIEDRQQCGVNWKEVNPHSQLNSAVDSIQIHNIVSLYTNQSEGASEDAGAVRLQTDLSTALSENKELVLKNPQYEDISDDDPSQPATELPTTVQFLSAGPEDPQYEDITEDESPQIESMAVETSSPTQVTVPNNTQSPFDNEDYGHLQGPVPKKQVSPDTERRDIAHCSTPFVEAGETGPLYPQCDSGPFSEDETDDDDDDDDWLFIPITISDLKFESENEDQDSPEIHVLDGGETGQCDTSPTRWPSPTPVPASPPSQLETFDTMASFMKQALGRSTPDHGMDSEGNPQPTKTRRESVDSCATEDSCDYSSALTTAHNYLTVSTMRSAPLLSETDDSEGEGNDGTNMPRSPNKSLDKSAMKSLGWTNGQNIPTEGDIIILDSEDEGDQNCKTESVIIIDSDTDDDDQTPRRNCILSSGSDSGDAPCVEEKQPSPKAVDREYRMAKEKLPETKLPVANSSLPHPRPTLHDTQLKEATQDACSDLSDSRGKSGQPTEAKCGSEHVQHKTNRQTTSKRKAVCDSGKVVEKSHFSKKKAKTKGILSSGSGDGGDSLRATKNRPSAETVERLRGTASGKQPKKSRRSSDDSSEKQPQSVGREAEPTLGRNPVVPRFVIEKPLQHNHSLKLFKETAVHRQGKDGSRSPKTSTASSNNTDSYASKKVRFVPTSKPANDKRHATENIQANVKPRLFSRQHSLPTFSSSSSTSDQLSEARQSSASSRDFSRSISLPTAKQSTAIPKHTSSSSLQRSRSHRNPSSFNPPDGPANGPSSSGTVHSLRNKRAKEIWEESYIPTRKDKKTSPGMKEDLRTTTNNLKRAARPDPRRRQKSQKSSTPLMKKSKIEAIGMTKAAAIEMTKSAGRDPPGEQRSFVGDHYKWSEKPTVAKPTKGSSREGIRYRPAPKTHR